MDYQVLDIFGKQTYTETTKSQVKQLYKCHPQSCLKTDKHTSLLATFGGFEVLTSMTYIFINDKLTPIDTYYELGPERKHTTKKKDVLKALKKVSETWEMKHVDELSAEVEQRIIRVQEMLKFEAKRAQFNKEFTELLKKYHFSLGDFDSYFVSLIDDNTNKSFNFLEYGQGAKVILSEY